MKPAYSARQLIRRGSSSDGVVGAGRRHRADVSLILITLLLTLLGLVVIYAVSPILSHKLVDDVNRNYFMYGQLRNIGVALVAFFIFSRIHWSRWRTQLLPLLLIGTGVALLLMFIPGVAITEKGATRWVGLGPLSFQPAELIKLTVAVLVASWFTRVKDSELANYKLTLWPVVILLGIVSIFVLIHQKDMGTMLVISSIVVAVFFMSGVRWQQLAILLGAGSAFGLLNIVLFPHRMERVRTFFSPSENLAETGYHLHQALIAIGSGGLFGLGLGRSIQVYGYLPEAANDSIFAIIGEMFGFIGASTIIILFCLLIYRMLRVAENAPDRFSQLLVVGITVWLGMQATVNMMAMLGIIPLTGIPLPFVSYGGSSLVFMLAALGIVVNVSKYTVRRPHADRSRRRGQRRAHNTHSSRRPSPQISS